MTSRPAAAPASPNPPIPPTAPTPATRPPSRTRAARAAGRRVLGVVALLAASGMLLLTALGAAAFSLLTAPWRPRPGRGRRTVGIAAVYSRVEIAGLAAAAGRRLRFAVDHDAERDRRDRVRSLTEALDALRAAAQRFGDLKVVQDPDTQPLPAGPLIVCGRHGGVGGAFLLAHILLSDHGRVPRVVLKRALSWDPLIDALLSGIPHAFIDPQPGDAGATAARVGTLARGMAADEALLIFPEGGNFTPGRRIRAIRRLRHRGLHRAAARAEQLQNVLPPHPDGLFAALEAAPDSDVVFVAHTGLEHLRSATDIWRAVPLRVPVVFTWWATPAPEIPDQADARMRWLEEQWARIDAWVADHRSPRR